MFSDLWTLSDKYTDPEELNVRKADFDVVSACAKAICPEDPDGFMSPGRSGLCDCYAIPDMDPAVDRILEAIDSGEKIGVFGDYDCDGVCAAAVIYDFFKNCLEYEVVIRIPEMGEGYGLSVKAVDEFAGQGIDLIITVDNGVSAAEAVAYAASVGIDVVVTDHHEVPEVLPDCICCDPLRADSVYPNRQICGCGVAYKLCEALSEALGIDGIDRRYLPLVAIATVGDVMSLTGENRSLVSLGTGMMDETVFPGLNALLSRQRKQKNVNDTIRASFLSYYITPVINAARRMGNAQLAMKLFLCGSESEALPVVEELLKLNEMRRAAVEGVRTAIDAEFEKYCLNPPDSAIVFMKTDSESEGINGIIAGKYAEKYRKPFAVMAPEKNAGTDQVSYKASVRSGNGLSVMKIFSECSDLLSTFGGHEKACGFSVREENIDELVRRASEIAKSMTDMLPAVETKEVLLYLPPNCINLETAEKMGFLEPIGEGNRLPVFITNDIDHVDVSRPGDSGTVIKYNIFFKGGNAVTGINFDSSDYYGMLKCMKPLAVMYTLGINEYQGRKSVQLRVIDFAEGKTRFDDEPVYGDARERCAGELFEAFHITKEEFESFYKALRSVGDSFSFRQIAELKVRALRQGGSFAETFTWFKLRYAVAVFTELGLIRKHDVGTYSFTAVTEKKSLSESGTFDIVGTRYD